jgi:hypothetical protein
MRFHICITPPQPSPASREREQIVSLTKRADRECPLSREAGEGQGGGRAALTYYNNTQ